MWMFVSKSLIKKICKIHFRTLHAVLFMINCMRRFCDYVSVHQKHLRILAIKVYEPLMKTNPDFMWDFSTKKSVTYDLRTGENPYLRKANSTCVKQIQHVIV